MDTGTKVQVQYAIDALKFDGTSSVISHLPDADLILVMEVGQIVEKGTHSSLLTAGGACATQFAAPLVEI